MTRKKWIIIIAGFFLAVLAVVGTSGFRLFEVDSNTGRTRSSLYVFCGIRVSQEVRETEFSRLVADNGLAKEPPAWKTAQRDVFGLCYFWAPRIGYTYGGVLTLLRMFDGAAKELEPSPEAQKQAVTEIVGHMQRGDPRMAKRRTNDIIVEWCGTP